MKIIPTRVHGVLDYLSVATLLALPRILNASDRATTLLTVVGITALLYSLLTRYELGTFKVLPVKIHLLLDFISGALLLAAPFFLVPDENQAVAIAFVVMGALEMGAALFTQSEPKRQPVPMTRTDVSGLPRRN